MSFQIVAIGEALWDLLPSGRALGGAPTNFASHSLALGANARLVTRVGNDELGAEMLRTLIEKGFSPSTISVDPVLPTGTASVKVNGSGQPRFVIEANVAWDHLRADDYALAAAANADAVYFGTLGQRTAAARRAYQALLAAAAPDALRVCDVNLRQEYFSPDIIRESLKYANVFKLNDDELPVLAQALGLPESPTEFMEQLATQFGLLLVALTCGSKGSLLYSRGEWSSRPSREVTVRDTVGAGDAFTAAMTLGYLCDWELDEINAFAGDVAAEVCSHVGATPPLPDRMRERLQCVAR